MASIGLQRELAANMGSIRTSCSPAAARKSGGRTLNSSINPATGANYPATGPTTDLAHLPFPSWGPIAGEIMNGRSNYYGWENTFTKRFSNRWQANATYTLSWFKDDGGIGSLTGPFVDDARSVGEDHDDADPVHGNGRAGHGTDLPARRRPTSGTVRRSTASGTWAWASS